MNDTISSTRQQRKQVALSSLNTVAADWLQAAIPFPTKTSQKQDNVVHDFRTAAKRARALVRLFGKALGQRTRRQENFRLRDAARALAGSRDAAVARELLRKLRRHHRGRTGVAITAALNGLAGHRFAAHTPGERNTAIAHAHEVLRTTARRLRQLRLSPKAACEAVETALRASYRRSRHQMKRARTTDDAAEYHEWRKLTKRLFYQLQLPGLACSKAERRLVRRLDELQERFGAEHDTQQVMALLHSEPTHFGGTKQTARVVALLEERGKNLRKRCLRLGAKVFSDKPEDFAKDIRQRLRHLRKGTKPA